MAKIGSVKNIGADWAQLVSRAQWGSGSNNSANVGELDPTIYTNEPNPDEGLARLGVDGSAWQGSKVFGQVPAMYLSDEDDDSSGTRVKSDVIDHELMRLIMEVEQRFGEGVRDAFLKAIGEKDIAPSEIFKITMAIAKVEGQDTSPDNLQQMLIDMLEPDSELDNIPMDELSFEDELWIRSQITAGLKIDAKKHGKKNDDPDDIN